MKLLPVALIANSDYDALIALWQAAGLPYRPNGRDTREAFEKQNAGSTQFPLGIRTEDGRLVGSVIATHDGRKGWINRLAVHPDYRRMGVGMQLIEAAEVLLREQGMDVICATIEPDNLASLNTFMAAGYAEHHGTHYVSKRKAKDS